MDYEEVIHLLEAEIAELKSQRMEPSLLTSKVGFSVLRTVLLSHNEGKRDFVGIFKFLF